MNKNYLVNSIMKDKVWTDEELAESAMNPIDLPLYDHSEPQPEEVRARLEESMRLGAIGVPLIDDRWLNPKLAEETQKRIAKIKTKYFKTYQDYFIAQENVRRQIEFKHEPVDIDLEQRLIAETRWIKQQRVEAARKRAMGK